MESPEEAAGPKNSWRGMALPKAWLRTTVPDATLDFPLPVSWWKQLLARIGVWQDTIAGWESFELASTMTILLLILYVGRFWYLQIPMTMLCAAAILYPPLKRNANFWFVVTVFLAVAHYYNWFLIDNHKYLLTYWAVALFCALLAPMPSKAIQVSARYLIAFTFLFATIWKIISPDFLTTSFFHFSLLMDERFATVAVLLGNIRTAFLVANQQAVKELISFDSTLQVAQLQSSLQAGQLAAFLTYWTIGIESLVAITFLWPQDRFIAKWRDFPLLLFLLSTYSLAPVIGFGWILVIMGITQNTTNPRFIRPLYLLTFFILQIYLMPWAVIVTYLLQMASRFQ